MMMGELEVPQHLLPKIIDENIKLIPNNTRKGAKRVDLSRSESLTYETGNHSHIFFYNENDIGYYIDPNQMEPLMKKIFKAIGLGNPLPYKDRDDFSSWDEYSNYQDELQVQYEIYDSKVSKILNEMCECILDYLISVFFKVPTKTILNIGE